MTGISFVTGLVLRPPPVQSSNPPPTAPLKVPEARKHVLEAGGEGELVLHVSKGSIQILTHDRNRVEADVVAENEVEAKEASEGMTLTREGNRVRIRPASGADKQVCYRVFVPRKYNIDLKGSEGRITVTNIEGNVKASTTEGQINLADVGGSVQAESNGGSIAVRSARGSVKTKTAGGDIAVGEVHSSASLETAGGSIQVLLARGYLRAKSLGGGIKVLAAYSNVKSDSVGGSITACFLGEPKDNSFLTTQSGSLETFIAPALPLDLKAVTESGKTTSGFPVETVTVQKETISQGKLNGGGKRLALRTRSGNIDIQPAREKPLPSLEKDFTFF